MIIGAIPVRKTRVKEPASTNHFGDTLCVIDSRFGLNLCVNPQTWEGQPRHFIWLAWGHISSATTFRRCGNSNRADEQGCGDGGRLLEFWTTGRTSRSRLTCFECLGHKKFTHWSCNRRRLVYVDALGRTGEGVRQESGVPPRWLRSIGTF